MERHDLAQLGGTIWHDSFGTMAARTDIPSVPPSCREIVPCRAKSCQREKLLGE
jgi:hypothetical protein